MYQRQFIYQKNSYLSNTMFIPIHAQKTSFLSYWILVIINIICYF